MARGPAIVDRRVLLVLELLVATALALGARRIARRAPAANLAAFGLAAGLLIVAWLAGGAAYLVVRKLSGNLVLPPLIALAAGTAAWAIVRRLARRRGT